MKTVQPCIRNIDRLCRGLLPALGLFVLLSAVPGGRAEAVKNGNELALAFKESDAAGRQKLQKERNNIFHTFRYLRITDISKPSETNRTVNLTTIEPSSDMQVLLVVSGGMSLKLAGELKSGDCVAARGRVKELGVKPNLMLVEPCVLQFKDRASPAMGEEMLKEVDKTAH